MKDRDVLLLAGGVGAIGLFVLYQQGTAPKFLDDLFRTVMPNSPTQAQRAAYYAQRAGGVPSRAGSTGYGATSQAPAYAGSLAGLGSFVGGLFTRLVGPGNAAPAGRPQASAGAGGGVAMPAYGAFRNDPSVIAGYGWDPTEPRLYFGEWDNSYGDFPDLGAYDPAAQEYPTQELIQSDYGTYDVLSGEWYE